MFKIQSNTLKGVVASLAKGARKAKLGERFIFIRSLEKNQVSFYFNGADTAVKKLVEVELQGSVDIATTVKELEQKVAALPSDEEILVEESEEKLKLKWGRNAEIYVDTVPETTPMLEIPDLDEKVKWGPGTLQGIARTMPPFVAAINSVHGSRNPSITGPNFILDEETGETLVRATDGYKVVSAKGSKLEWFGGQSASIEIGTIMGFADILPQDLEVLVGVNKKANLVVFQSGNTTAVTKTLVRNISEHRKDVPGRYQIRVAI